MKMKGKEQSNDKWIQSYKKTLNSSRKTAERPIEQGNIDLNNRPVYRNNDGSISTVRSMSINEDGKEVLIPTIGKNEKGAYQMSDNEAIDHYHKTGEHLGKFNTVDGANAYAEWLHNDQAKKYSKAELRKDVQQQPIWRKSTPEQREIQNKVIRQADRGTVESDPTQGWGSKLNNDVLYNGLQSKKQADKFTKAYKKTLQRKKK